MYNVVQWVIVFIYLGVCLIPSDHSYCLSLHQRSLLIEVLSISAFSPSAEGHLDWWGRLLWTLWLLDAMRMLYCIYALRMTTDAYIVQFRGLIYYVAMGRPQFIVFCCRHWSFPSWRVQSVDRNLWPSVFTNSYGVDVYVVIIRYREASGMQCTVVSFILVALTFRPPISSPNPWCCLVSWAWCIFIVCKNLLKHLLMKIEEGPRVSASR